jgi:ankyrin repeat protein
VELLLTKYSGNLNAPDYFDKTPLYYAASNGHMDVAELLRQHGGHE